MHYIIDSLKERKAECAHLKLNPALTQDSLRAIKKNERKRVKDETYYFNLLYQFSRLSADENRANFYEFSIELLNKQPDPTTKNIFDQIAEMYLAFFDQTKQKEKVLKIKVILDNNMHKNYSFLLILLKWVVEYYKAQFQQIISEVESHYRIPLLTQKVLVSQNKKFQLRKKGLPSLQLELNKLTIPENIQQSHSLDLRNKQRLEGTNRKKSYYPSINQEASTMKGREKQRSIDYDERTKRAKHKAMRETYKEVIGDVDWEWIRLQEKSMLSSIQQRNTSISKGIHENEQQMSQRKQL